MENSKKVEQYELIKVIATILVVLAHITRMYTGEGVVNPLNESLILNYLTKFIYSFHMPLFVAVSGAIYYYVKVKLNKYNDNKIFVKNKAKRLLIPYMVFGVFYVAPVMVLCNFTDLNFIKYTIKGIIISLDSRHLWYVLMLFNVFIIFQFGSKLINKYPKIFVVLFILCNIISYKLPSYFQINNTFRYILYFYLGYLFEKNRYKVKINISAGAICTLVLLILFNYLLLVNSNFKLNIILKLMTALLGIAFIYITAGYFNNEKIISTKLYKALKENSFGIYLFHPMIIYILFYYLGNKNINPFLLTVITFVITIISSDLLTRLIRILRLNIIIGEKNKINLKSYNKLVRN